MPPNIPNNVIIFDVLKLMQVLIYHTYNLQFLLLQLNKPEGKLVFFLFKESNLRKFGVCFNDKTAFVSPKTSLIDSFGLCFSFWLIDLSV